MSGTGSSSRWRFVNTRTGAEILVNDPASAVALNDLLTAHHPEWKGSKETPGDPAAKKPETTRSRPGAPTATLPVKVPVNPPKPRKNRSPRFNVKFRVILTHGKQSFRTVTQDISITGMRLEHKVPKSFLGQRCRVFIGRTRTSENIEISCVVLADDPINPVRMQFTEMTDRAEKELEQWIEAEFLPHSRGQPQN